MCAQAYAYLGRGSKKKMCTGANHNYVTLLRVTLISHFNSTCSYILPNKYITYVMDFFHWNVDSGFYSSFDPWSLNDNILLVLQDTVEMSSKWHQFREHEAGIQTIHRAVLDVGRDRTTDHVMNGGLNKAVSTDDHHFQRSSRTELQLLKVKQHIWCGESAAHQMGFELLRSMGVFVVSVVSSPSASTVCCSASISVSFSSSTGSLCSADTCRIKAELWSCAATLYRI